MYKEILDKHQIGQTPEFTLSIISSEVGSLQKCRVYQERFGNHGFIAEESIAIADLMTMVGLLAEQKGLDPVSLAKDGLERFDHRMSEVHRKELERRYGDVM